MRLYVTKEASRQGREVESTRAGQGRRCTDGDHRMEVRRGGWEAVGERPRAERKFSWEALVRVSFGQVDRGCWRRGGSCRGRKMILRGRSGRDGETSQRIKVPRRRGERHCEEGSIPTVRPDGLRRPGSYERLECLLGAYCTYGPSIKLPAVPWARLAACTSH